MTCDKCGYTFMLEVRDQRRAHARWHREWAGGVPLPARLFPTVDDGVVSVTPQDAASHSRIVTRLARMMGWENEYDGGLWAGYAAWPQRERVAMYRRDDEAPLAFLVVRERRAIGLVIVRQRPVWSRVNINPNVPKQYGIHGLRRPNVDAVFVCHDYQRRGVARALICHIAGYYHSSPHELVWLGELSDAGRALAHSFAAPNGTFLYG